MKSISTLMPMSIRFSGRRPPLFACVLLIALSACLASPGLMADSTNRNLQTGLQLNVRVLLQGAYVSSTGLMRDDLRASGLLPVQQPYLDAPFNYPGTESLNQSLSSIVVGGDADAAVDWVLLEIRSATDVRQVVASKAVLVQADGDLMDAETGETTLYFQGMTWGDYHVAVRHRNHLGVVTALPLGFGAATTVVDFTLPDTPVAGGDTSRFLADGVACLWAGDINQDQRIIANGVGSDATTLISSVLTATGNSGFNANFRLRGYVVGDLNLDGAAVCAGPGSDNTAMVTSVLLHPGNIYFAGNYIVRGELAD